MSLKHRTTEELEARYVELESWMELDYLTAGSCRYEEVYREQREALGDLDPDDPWASLWAIDKELGKREGLSA